MTFVSREALPHTLGDDKWLDRINPPHKEQTLHFQHLASTKEESNPTAKKPIWFGVKATEKQRFYLDDAVVGANIIKLTKEWNDPSLSCLDRLLILRQQIVTFALIVAGDESDPYITIVTNPSTTRIDIDDETLGAPVWSDILSEELACKIGVPYNCPSHLAAAATTWPTSTDKVSSREEIIQKMQAVLLYPIDRFGTQYHGAIHHVLLFPALICPPVGFFWSTTTTFSEFVASIKALNEPAYASFLTVLDLFRAMIEQWFDGVNVSPKDFCFRIQSAQPLMNVIPSTENPNPDVVEDESRHVLDPILELVDQLVDQLLCFYDYDGVMTDCESLIRRYGRMCFWWVHGSCVSFLKYCILLPWKALELRVDRWIPPSYRRVKVLVAENESCEPTRILTQLDLAVGKTTAYEGKATFPTDAANGDPADFIRVNQASRVQQHGDEEKVIVPAIITCNVTPKKDKETHPHPADTANNDPAEIVPVNNEISKVQENDNEEKMMIPAIVLGNVSPNDNLEDLSRCIVNGIRKLHGEKAEVVSCYFISRRKGAANAYLEFKEIRHARMALHLDGIQQFSGILSVQLVQPGENIAAAEIQDEKTPELEKPKVSNNDAYKRELCIRYSSGYCWFGDKCDFAHGVLDLRLNYHTKLHPERCLYIRNIIRNYPTADLMNYIRRKVEKSGHSSPEFTAIHVRGSMSDALVEFQEDNQASVARQILDGISVVPNTIMEIYPWKSAYQNAFVVYFKEDERIAIDVGSSKARNGATLEGITATAVIAEGQETNRKEKMLRHRLIRAKQEIKDLQEEKRLRDASIRLLVTSLQSMKLSLSAALSEIDLATQQISDIQQIRGITN